MPEYQRSLTVNQTLVATSSRILTNNPRRRYVLLTNDSAVNVNFAMGRPATANDHPLNANGGAFEINALNLWTGELWGIGDGAVIAVTEL